MVCAQSDAGIIFNTRVAREAVVLESLSYSDAGIILIPVWQRGIVLNLVCSPIMRVLFLIPVWHGER